MLTIQIVSVMWGKACRGVEGATRRNQLPRAFTLCENALHKISRYGYSQIFDRIDFEEKQVRIGQVPLLPAEIEGLLLKEVEGKLIVDFSWKRDLHGMPNRGLRNRVAIVEPGECVQIRINGRHVVGGPQWYTQQTFNVAYGLNFGDKIFLNGEFSHVLSLEANLF